MRAALNAVATSAPQWLIEHNRPAWAERYGARVEQYRLPKGEAARQALGEAIGADGHDLLAALFAETQRFWLCRLPAVERLRIIWIQQFYHDQGRVRWRRPVDQPTNAFTRPMIPTPATPKSATPAGSATRFI
jgi:transposase